MNKKLMAVAVAGAIGTLGASAAFAQSSTVTLSGSLNFNYGYFDNGGTSNPGVNPKVKTDALSNQESEWVLKGQENLGGGMAAYFMCSSSMDITGGSASNMCARNSVIGLKASWGSIDWGNYDTPAKRLAAQFDPFPISAAMGQGAQMWNSTASNTANPTGSTVATSSSFSRRQQNLITYNMPTMNGFDASFAWSAANEASAATSASTIQKPRLWSAMAAYTNGPLALGIAYERHVDYNPGQLVAYNGSNDSLVTLGAGYTFMGSLRISGVYNSINYNNISAGQDMSVKTWGLYGDWAVSGPHRVRLGYGSQGSSKGTYGAAAGTAVGSWIANAGAGQTGSQKIHGEYAYALSKRTELGLAYARAMNDRLSTITVGTGGNNPNAGETQSFMGMLIRHKF
jgi:predicted porin